MSQMTLKKEKQNKIEIKQGEECDRKKTPKNRIVN
jgi:hypothetical protein